MKHRFIGKGFAALALAACSGAVAHAQTTRTWSGGGSTTWGTANNWDGNIAPTAIDTAAFGTVNNINRRNPTVDADASVAGIIFTSGADAYTFGGTFTLSIGTGGIVNNSTTAQTFNTKLSLSADQTWNTNTGNLTVTGSVSGTGVLTKTGTGTLTLNSATGNSFTGATKIDGGTLTAGTTNALGSTGSITANSGGTLLLAGTGSNRIKNSAALDLNGGTLNLAGLSEAESSGAGIGALTLSKSSVIDFGVTPSGSTNTILWFSSGSRTDGLLTIQNWTGGTDQFRFTSSTGVDSTFLANVTFDGYGPGAQLINQGGYYEMVPVPEPSTFLAGGLLVGVLGWRERKRLTKLAALMRTQRQHAC